MFEKPPVAETPQSKQRKAYRAFVELAKEYGRTSPEGGSTVKKYLDDGKGDCDLVSGRFFGDQAPTIEVFFRKGNDAQQLTLSRDALGEVTVVQVLYFQRQEGKKGKVLVQQDGSGKEPDIDILCGILIDVAQSFANAKDRRAEVMRVVVGMRRVHAQEVKARNGEKPKSLSESP
jgi:hypothetical protein